MSFFNLVFVAGLLVAVRVMVAGVERTRGAAGATASAGAVVRTRWAMLGGALTLSGFIGSLMTRLEFSRGAIVFATVVAATFGALGARYLVSRAVAMRVTDHTADPRFSLQGVPAVVVDDIPAFGTGRVRLPAKSGSGSIVPARSVDGATIERGAEVGVERIDDGVAFVEMWSAIEARL